MLKKTPAVWIGMLTLCLALFAGAAQAQPPFTTTTIVNGNLTPAANGAALLAAVAAATPPALIKVEPGFYDLSGGQLVMRNLVDVEGSGRDVTFIISDTSASFTNATVRVPPNVIAQLRGLTVQHRSNGTGTGVSIASDFFLLTGVNIETRDEGESVGVLTTNCNTVMNDVFARVNSATRGIGFRLQGGGPILGASFSFVSESNDMNMALQVTDNTVATVDQFFAVASQAERNVAVAIESDSVGDLRNVRGTAVGGAASVGLMISKQASADVKESTFKSLSDSFSVAFLLEDEARAKATESTFEADPITIDHLGVYAVRLTGSANLDSNQSNYDGTSFAAQNIGTGQARFGASQLIGSVLGVALTSFRCIFSYNGSYTARNAFCV